MMITSHSANDLVVDAIIEHATFVSSAISLDFHIVSHTFTSGFFSPNFSLSVSQISLRSLPCFSMLLMVL